MSIFNDIMAMVTVATTVSGYPSTDQQLPYVVGRPLIIDDLEVALAGNGNVWDFQFSLYCCAASVEASFNLAVAVMGELHGQRAGGTALSTSMGYSGAQVEGHYESQVTVQLNQGSI